MLVGVIPTKPIELAALLLGRAPTAPLTHRDGNVHARALGRTVIVSGARLRVGDALREQQDDPKDAVEALNAQADLVADTHLVGSFDGLSVHAHVPGAHGGRRLGAGFQLAGRPQPGIHAHGGRGEGTE